MRRSGKVTLVEGDNCGRAPVDCGFQNHIVVGVAQLRPPPKCEADWLSDGGEIVQDTNDFGNSQTSRREMFWPGQNRFVLQEKRDRKQQTKLVVKREQEQLPGSPALLPKAATITSVSSTQERMLPNDIAGDMAFKGRLLLSVEVEIERLTKWEGASLAT